MQSFTVIGLQGWKTLQHNTAAQWKLPWNHVGTWSLCRQNPAWICGCKGGIHRCWRPPGLCKWKRPGIINCSMADFLHRRKRLHKGKGRHFWYIQATARDIYLLPGPSFSFGVSLAETQSRLSIFLISS